MSIRFVSAKFKINAKKSVKITRKVWMKSQMYEIRIKSEHCDLLDGVG